MYFFKKTQGCFTMQNKKKEIEAYPKSKAKTMHFKEEGKNVKQLNNNNNKKIPQAVTGSSTAMAKN